ncbi:CUB and sushi domain-containing protein 3 [Lingula anatina]|uniref:CUB and sushi domain-containing protein 3 n=1 Tax=Lingula anatina TaxID=7574 RepID=A0A1S3J275_LINAN|nr:CUB and sushi domain-containing protein 3 [Lingula anatina]|eukprot:XP_013404517.1 CUB and sushi domain-containing protein 3 [Lingula anatina]
MLGQAFYQAFFHVGLLTVLSIFLEIGLTVGEDSGCGNERTRTKAPGNLTSHPEYGQTHIPHNKCMWSIQSPPDKYVALQVQDFGNLLCHSSLFLWTNFGGKRWPGWHGCSLETSAEILGSSSSFSFGTRRGGLLQLVYNGLTDPANRTGFFITYDFKEPGCHGYTRLTGTPAWFASHPGAGHWVSEGNAHCTWTITAPRNQFVVVRAENIWLHCVGEWQTLTVYDSAEAREDTLIARMACSNRLPLYASSGNNMFFVYRDIWASSGRGFNISYSFHSKRQSGCGDDMYYNSTSGVLQSHPGADGTTTSRYFPWSRCHWSINIPSGAWLGLRFEWFDVYASSVSQEKNYCEDDKLIIQIGDFRREFCNIHRPDGDGLRIRLPSTPTVINISFITGPVSLFNKQGRGFRIVYAVMCRTADDTYVGVREVHRQDHNCSHGEVPAGDLDRVCLPNGTLAGVPVICKPVDCGLASDVRNAVPHYTGTTHRGRVRYTCTKGHEHTAGSAERICTADGVWKWTGDPMECEVIDCGTPPIIEDASSILLNSSTWYESVVSYFCPTGYFSLDGNKTKVCLDDGLWYGEDLICQRVNCGSPVIVGNATRTVDTTSYLGRAIYACFPGFSTPDGETIIVRTCSASGKWEGTFPECNIVDCGIPEKLHGARMQYTSTVYGSLVNYTCDTGYTHVHGWKTRKCHHSGAWVGEEPVCQVVDCGSPPLVQNTVSSLNGTTYGNVAVYSCLLGYRAVNGFHSIATCDAAGHWIGEHLRCEALDCGPPPKLDNSIVRTPYGTTYLKIAIYVCLPGYRGVSFMIKFCKEDSFWKGPDLQCIAVPTSQTSHPEIATPGLYKSTSNILYPGTRMTTSRPMIGERAGLLSTHRLTSLKHAPVTTVSTNAGPDVNGKAVSALRVSEHSVTPNSTFVHKDSGDSQKEPQGQTNDATLPLKNDTLSENTTRSALTASDVSGNSLKSTQVTVISLATATVFLVVVVVLLLLLYYRFLKGKNRRSSPGEIVRYQPDNPFPVVHGMENPIYDTSVMPNTTNEVANDGSESMQNYLPGNSYITVDNNSDA